MLIFSVWVRVRVSGVECPPLGEGSLFFGSPSGVFFFPKSGFPDPVQGSEDVTAVLVVDNKAVMSVILCSRLACLAPGSLKPSASGPHTVIEQPTHSNEH